LALRVFFGPLEGDIHQDPLVGDDRKGYDVEDDDPGPVVPGQRTGQVKSVFRALREVGRVEDGADG
jgi:hypothetical protein